MQQWPQDWKRSVFIPIPKNSNAKECSNYHKISLISHASKKLLKILQVKLQQYVNYGLLDVKLALVKAEKPEIQLTTSVGSSRKQWSSTKTSTSALLTVLKPLKICEDHRKLWKILKEWRIPDHMTCLLINLCADQEQQSELDMEPQTACKLGKAVFCYHAYLTYGLLLQFS